MEIRLVSSRHPLCDLLLSVFKTFFHDAQGTGDELHTDAMKDPMK